MKNYLSLFLLLITFHFAAAQKDVKVSFEEIKEQCSNVPFEKRLRVTVPRFSVTTSSAPYEFGGNLATMLTNALQQINCYRVLESLRNASDMNDEIDYGEGKYANKKSTPKAGKQLGAQLIITGEITEYNIKSTGLGVGLLKVGSNKAKIGFILKMINPETREVLFSRSINVEAKAAAGTSFGLFGANLVNSQKSDPAISNACEQGIIQAVEFLASKKDILQLPTVALNAAKPLNSINEIEINLANASFTSFNEMANLIKNLSTCRSLDKSLSEGVAAYTVKYVGSADTLLAELNKKLGAKYEVTGYNQNKIDLKVK